MELKFKYGCPSELEIKIRKGIYLWGYYPVLHYLKEQEEDENFELCAVIKKNPRRDR